MSKHDKYPRSEEQIHGLSMSGAKAHLIPDSIASFYRCPIERVGDHDLPVPERATNGSAAFDLRAQTGRRVTLSEGEEITIGTGFAFAIPDGFVGLVVPRSSLYKKFGLRLINTIGVIDSDYRGEVKMMLKCTLEEIDHGIIEHGDRLAQLLIVPAPRFELEEVDELPDTERGDGGFESTGK